MKVGIIGYGFVGKALCFGLNKDVEVYKVDPKLKTNISDLAKFNPDIIFICVPTPMNDDGTQDIKILETVADEIFSNSIISQIVLKSTVLPDHIKKLEKLFPNIVLNPEFLREQHANDDFINAKLILLGGKEKNILYLADFYKNYTQCITKNYQLTDLISASLIKYAINAFLASKVIFFNELHSIFVKSKSSINWQSFIDIISVDERIGKSHMQVPGSDNKFGYGGPCFPKDCNALIKYSEKIGEPFELLKKSSEINNGIRRQYDSLSKREKEQNINYNDS